MSGADADRFAIFVEKWRPSAAAERANKDSFLNDLCAVLDVPAPDPTTGDAKHDHYVFEKSVQVSSETGRTTKFIDLYKRGCFVLEAKQGSESAKGRLGTAKRRTGTWDVAMNAAFHQAAAYAVALDQPPPLVLVTDIGFCIDIYASFDGTPRYRALKLVRGHNRIYLSELEKNRELLRALFLDPLSLDPSKIAIAVTRGVAGYLADLTRRLEKAGHAPQAVADFLMRCIFTMFAEDVGLLPEAMFTTELRDHWIKSPRSFTQGVENLWRAMNDGLAFGFFGKLLHFNGGLFKSPAALPLEKGDLEVLLVAASCSWNRVEPAILGTLFEGALDKKERHSLGAHFTPRAYVERLVRPTIEEPIREDWDATQAKIRDLASRNKIKEAKVEVRAFMRRLSEIRVLDPACGSGNFLYVALDLLKAIEDEAFALLLALEGGQTELCLDAPEITPKQFMGIEINPRAKAIAELVLWIGYLQWHFRTKHRGGKPREPVLEDYKNIACTDALLTYEAKDLARDQRTGKPITRWDGETMKVHPVTGEKVPDERFTSPVYQYASPRRAEWPHADFIIGNPPFIGNKRMKQLLGEGYVDMLREVHNAVPKSADLVMYWWQRAAEATQAGGIRRFGLITTNSITQGFNQRIVESHLGSSGSLVFAIPDHPWVDEKNGAQVRVAMTVFATGELPGRIEEVVSETPDASGSLLVTLATKRGKINSALDVGLSLAGVARLRSNRGLTCPGVQLSGQGFVLAPEDLTSLSQTTQRALVRPYVTGRDLTQIARVQFVIDTFGTTDDELRAKYPDAFQRLVDRVKPERQENPRASYARNWWLHSEPRSKFRAALAGLGRYIATSRTARHRVFQFLPAETLAETKVLVIASDDAAILGVLSSRAHVAFANANGGWLGVGNDSTYNHSACFDTFPFPEWSDSQRAAIADAAERLDVHRKSVQLAHPRLAITDMYNVVVRLRAGEVLSAPERAVHEQGLTSVLMAIHDDLDELVLDSYGLSRGESDENILKHLASLNAQRASEEGAGLVRWLRPELKQTGGAEPVEIEWTDNHGPGIAKSRPPKGPGIAATRTETGKRKSKRATR